MCPANVNLEKLYLCSDFLKKLLPKNTYNKIQIQINVIVMLCCHTWYWVTPICYHLHPFPSPDNYCIVSDHIHSLTFKQVYDKRWGAKINSVSAILHQYGTWWTGWNHNWFNTLIRSEVSAHAHEGFFNLGGLVVWLDGSVVVFEIDLWAKFIKVSLLTILWHLISYKKCWFYWKI